MHKKALFPILFLREKFPYKYYLKDDCDKNKTSVAVPKNVWIKSIFFPPSKLYFKRCFASNYLHHLNNFFLFTKFFQIYNFILHISIL